MEEKERRERSRVFSLPQTNPLFCSLCIGHISSFIDDSSDQPCWRVEEITTLSLFLSFSFSAHTRTYIKVKTSAACRNFLNLAPSSSFNMKQSVGESIEPRYVYKRKHLQRLTFSSSLSSQTNLKSALICQTSLKMRSRPSLVVCTSGFRVAKCLSLFIYTVWKWQSLGVLSLLTFNSRCFQVSCLIYSEKTAAGDLKLHLYRLTSFLLLVWYRYKIQKSHFGFTLATPRWLNYHLRCDVICLSRLGKQGQGHWQSKRQALLLNGLWSWKRGRKKGKKFALIAKMSGKISRPKPFQWAQARPTPPGDFDKFKLLRAICIRHGENLKTFPPGHLAGRSPRFRDFLASFLSLFHFFLTIVVVFCPPSLPL